MLSHLARIPIVRISFAPVLLATFAFGAASLRAETVPPKPISVERPVYPADLKKAGKEGKAVVQIRVEEDGSVGSATVKSANEPAFGEAAVAAVKSWKFTPGTRDGNPTALTVDVPFLFNLSIEERINFAMKREVFRKFDETTVPAKELKEKPKLKTPVKPAYPKSLVGSGLSEDVKLEYVIDRKGEVINPAIVSQGGRDEMRLAAIGTVVRYAYEPVKHQGKPVNVAMSTTIKLRDPEAQKKKEKEK